jgi:CheY-like chemotaxis protein
MGPIEYCLCCGENVPYNTISRQGKVQETCQYCGFVLNINVKKEETKKKNETETETVTVDCVLLADDSPLTRDIIKAMLVQKKVAESVLAFNDGQQLVSEFTKRMTGGSSVTMIILDLQMPVMDGITTARIVRNLEDKFKVPRIPILFFSARKCDESLKKQMALYSPAVYLNKGSDTDPEILLERVDQLMSYILRKGTSPSPE